MHCDIRKAHSHYWKGMTRKKALLEDFHQIALLQVSQMVLTSEKETQNVHYIIYSLVILVKSKFHYRKCSISLLEYLVNACIGPTALLYWNSWSFVFIFIFSLVHTYSNMKYYQIRITIKVKSAMNLSIFNFWIYAAATLDKL